MDEHPWPGRVERVLEKLSRRWQTFDEIYTPWSALDAKQHTGALVWLRNRQLVESRRTADCTTQWRLTRRGLRRMR